MRAIVIGAMFVGSMVQTPLAGFCQMMISPVSAVCPMPCCKKSPIPKCAMKVQAPRDFILSLSALPDFSAQKVIMVLCTDTFHVGHTLKHQLLFLTQQLKILFLPAKILTRGPPADIHLLFA